MSLAAFAPGPAWADPAPAEVSSSRQVTARGEGATLDQAVRSALRRAVEQAVGVHVSAITAVDRFEVVRNEIVAHAEGYVSRYRVIRQGTAENGIVFAEIEAEVDGGRVRDSADAIPALLAMAGHPRIVVLGVDGGFDAVSAVLPEAVALRDAAGDLLRDRFHFATVDTKALPRKGAAQKRQDALAAARTVAADYALLVSLSGGSSAPADLTMEAIKLSDGTVVARDSATATLAMGGGAGSYRAVSDRVFPLTVSMAHQIAGNVQQAVTGGDGVRYSVMFAEFPAEDIQAIERSLSGLPGFVRLQTDARDGRSITYSVWSLQPVGEFDAALKALLAERPQQRVRARMTGHSFRFEYVDPVFR